MARIEGQTRRHFLRNCTTGLGAMFLGTLAQRLSAADGLDFTRAAGSPLASLPPEFAARAKRVIFLHMAGAPSQLELFDYKPELQKLNGQDCPQSFLEGKRFAFITGVPKMLGTQYPFHQSGRSGAWISDRLPHLERHLDDICFIKSMHTDQFNHAPAQLLFQTGSPRLGGGAALGSWATYGLGTENQNLPGFIVLASGDKLPDGGKSLWSSGFLPSVYQGVQCRSQGEPVLYLSSPPGVSRPLRRRMLDAIDEVKSRGSCGGGRSRDDDTGGTVRNGFSYAVGGERCVGSFPGTGGGACRLRHQTWRRKFCQTTVCWPAGSPNAGCALSSSSIGVGTPMVPKRKRR